MELQERKVREFAADNRGWQELYELQIALNQVLQYTADWSASLELLDRAVKLWESGVPQTKRNEAMQHFFWGFRYYEAYAFARMGQFEKADLALEQARIHIRGEQDRARTDCLGPYVTDLRRLDEGDHVAVTAAWSKRAAAALGDPETAAFAAHIFVRACSTVRKDNRLSSGEQTRQAEDYAVAAVRYLRTGIESGWWQNPGRATSLRTDPIFAPLRGRQDFGQLLAQVNG